MKDSDFYPDFDKRRKELIQYHRENETDGKIVLWFLKGIFKWCFIWIITVICLGLILSLQLGIIR